MKLKVYITPSTLFTPGTAERLLGLIGAGPVGYDKQGRIIAHLTQAQIELWGIKGGAHRLEIAPEVEPAPVPAPVVESEPERPSIIVEEASGVRKVVTLPRG